MKQATAPFVALQRARWSAAAEFPPALHAEFAKYLRGRAIGIGCRRYYIDGPALTPKLKSPIQLKHLRGYTGVGQGVRSEHLISAEAVRDLFDATEAQMLALQSVGILPKGRRWLTAREVDVGFDRMTRWTTSRPRARTDEEFAPLWNVGIDNSSELEVELRRVMTGETPTATWLHIKPASLGNLFIRTGNGVHANEEQRSKGDAP